MSIQNQPATQGSLKGLLEFAQPYKKHLLISLFLSMMGTLSGLVPFVVTASVVALIAESQSKSFPEEMIWKYVGIALIATLLKYLLLGSSTLIAHTAAYNILYELRIKISQKLSSLPLGFFNNHLTGKIKKIIMEDVEQMETFIAHQIPDFLGSIIYIIFTTLVLFVIDWRLALATFCVVPLGVIAQILSMSKVKDDTQNFFSAQDQMNSTMIEYIQGMPVIKAFNHTVQSFTQYARSVNNCMETENTLIKAWFLPMTFFTVLVSANLLVLLPVGGWLYLTNDITLSTFVLFLLLGLGYGPSLSQLLSFGSLLTKNMEGQGRIQTILSAESLPEEKSPVPIKKQDIKADQVEFGYNDISVLKKIDFQVNVGKYLAIVGPSGAGKTTIARLIPRFWDVDGGKICIGGDDIRHVKIDDLMAQVTFVFQHVFLFNDTIMANLMVGNPSATEIDVITAAKAANCHDFIMSFPDGYQNIIGEKGIRLSGGEKQRLSIVRAILKQAPIIILDEATAFIDPEKEALIQQSIDQLSRDKTLIVIAHRLSTIIEADQILVVDQGRVVAKGQHQELLERSPLYSSLWNSHMSAMEWKFHS